MPRWQYLREAILVKGFIYSAYYKKYSNQYDCSSAEQKLNYKSYILLFNYFGFVIFNGLNIAKYLSRDDIGDLLLKKHNLEWDASYPK